MNVAVPLLRAKKNKESAPQPDTAGAPPVVPSPEEPPPAAEDPAPTVHAQPIRGRLREWIRTIQRNPDAEAAAAEERRARLLEELNRAVADAPEDVPIKDIVARLNRHNGD